MLDRELDLSDWVYCLDCRYAHAPDVTCPNPACWPGLRNWHIAMKAWRAECKAYKQAQSNYFQPGVLDEMFARMNAMPRPEDFYVGG